MKKKLLAGLVAGGVASATLFGAAALSPSTASATDPITRLQRQVRVLQGQVTTLRHQVKGLSHDAYVCTFYDLSTPTQFDDGSTGYPLYYWSTC